MPPPAIQSAFDEVYVVEDHWYWRADFVNEIPRGVEIHAKFGAEMPTWKATMHMYPIDAPTSTSARLTRHGDLVDATYGAVIAESRS